MSVYFKYGAMGCGKSVSALTTAHNYESHGFEVICFTSKKVCREKQDEVYGYIESRLGVKRLAYMLDEEKDIIDTIDIGVGDCDRTVIIIDEVSFLSVEFIESLFKLTIETGVPIICYGLLTDFKTRMFPASQRLIELGAKLERLKSVDNFGEVPVINSLWIDGEIHTTGKSIQMGREEKYKALSLRQYWVATGKWQN